MTATMTARSWMADYVADYDLLTITRPEVLPSQAVEFESMTALRHAAAVDGCRFFDLSVCRSWRRVVFPTLYGGRFFVTSEQVDGVGRRTYIPRYAFRHRGRIGVMQLGSGGELSASLAMVRDAAHVLFGRG